MKKHTLLLTAISLLTATSFAVSFPRPEKIPAPEKKDMELKEIVMNKFRLTGKVIETEVDHSHSFKVEKRGLYSSLIHRHPGGHFDDPMLQVYFPEEGKEVAEDLHKAIASGSRTTLYLYIVSENEIYVVGTKYKKRKKVYLW